MNSLKISDSGLSGYSKITVRGLENTHLLVVSKKVNDLNPFSKLKIWLSEKIFGKNFIRLNEGTEPILLKISDLANKLGISKQELVQSVSDGTAEELILLELEASKYHISRSVILDYKNRGDLGELRYLEYLADSLSLPLSELLEAKKQNKLEPFLTQAQEIEKQCHATFEKLDKVLQDDITTKEDETIFQTKMTPEEIDSMKKVIRSAYKILATHPVGQKEMEQIIAITKNHHILIQSSKNSFKIIGLFGQLIGHGGAGAAVRTLDLLEGTWTTGEEAVLKIPKSTDKDSRQILQEETIIKKIHDGKSILGIQKPVRVFRDVFKGKSKHCHLGAFYQTDLFAMTLGPVNKLNLKESKMSMAYQLAHGIVHMHEKEITHGDIKPENIFVDPIDQRLFLSDFGGAIDHSNELVRLQNVVSDSYRLKQDDIASKKAYNASDRKLYLTIEKKADVFALCAVFCSIFTNEYPFEKIPRHRECRTKEGLQKQLIDSGLSSDVAKLLMQGLEFDYEKRPDAKTIFTAIKNELIRLAPERAGLLINLSEPI